MLADTNVRPASAGKTRLTSPERRAAIVSAAMRLFAKNGFRGATTREIAMAVGVSEPVLYQHFATKRDLYTAIVDQMVADVDSEFQTMVGHLQSAADPKEFLTALGGAVIDWYMTRREHIRLLFFSALEGHELAEMWHQKTTAPFLQMVQNSIAHWQSQGLLRDVNPQVAARAFIGMVAHYGLTTTVFEMPMPGIDRKEALAHFVELILAGLNKSHGEDVHA